MRAATFCTRAQACRMYGLTCLGLWLVGPAAECLAAAQLYSKNEALLLAMQTSSAPRNSDSG